jgi:hypothetical protein
MAILSDIIKNENEKLLQINYLAQKVDVLFNFLSRSHCTCSRTYGKTTCSLKISFFLVPFYAFFQTRKWLLAGNGTTSSKCIPAEAAKVTN